MMEENKIKRIEAMAQELLDNLQGTSATVLYIGADANRFVMSGDAKKIMCEIVFGMVRFPVIESIIKACASCCDEVKEKYGDEINGVDMCHLVEKYWSADDEEK